nr:TolC family protein [uncultured Porphyromonas sp.]
MMHRTVIKASLALLLLGGATWRLCAIEDYRPSETDTLTGPTPLAVSITIDDAVRIALSESTSVLVGDMAVEKERYTYKSAVAQLFPSINLQGSYGYTIKKQVMYLDGFPGAASMPGASSGIEIGRTHNIQGGVTLALPVVNASLWKSISISKENLQLALEKAQTSRLNKVAEVRKAFLQALLAEDSYEVLKKSYANAQRNYQLVENNFKQGLVAQYDLLRSEVQMKNLEPNVLQADDARRMARRSLLILMGLSPETDITLRGSLTDFAPEVLRQYVEAEQNPLEGNATLRELAIQRNLVNHATELKKLAFLPTLNIAGSYTYSFASNDLKLNNSKLWTPHSMVSLSLSFPLFTGGRRIFDLKGQKIALMQFDLNARDAERQVSTAYEEAKDRLRRAARTYSVSEGAVSTAERGYTIAEKRFETGEGTLLEVNDADLSLLQARLNYHQSIYNFMVAHCDLDLLTGKGVPEETPTQQK